MSLSLDTYNRTFAAINAPSVFRSVYDYAVMSGHFHLEIIPTPLTQTSLNHILFVTALHLNLLDPIILEFVLQHEIITPDTYNYMLHQQQLNPQIWDP